GTITGASSVTVQLSGSSTQSTTTDGSGNYNFSDLPAGGNYTVTPSKSGYGFTPGSRSFNPLNSNQSNQDFSAAPTMYTISGTITGASSVTVTLSGDDNQTTVTDLLGFYSFDFVQPGTITITPSKTGYIFTPVSRSYTPLNSDQPFQDFTAYSLTEYHFISGTISGAPSVTVTLSGDASRSTVTDYSGYYQFSDLVLGGYTITPSKPGYIFNPENRSYDPLVSDQTSQNFTATATQFEISGRISGVSQVTVYLTGGVTASTSTDIEGDYSFSGLPGGANYVVMPSKTGYGFTPSSRSYTPLAADQTHQDFSGSLQTFSIGGQVSDPTSPAVLPPSLPLGQSPIPMEMPGFGRLPISQVIIQLSGGINRLDTTDLGGNYLFEGLPAVGSYSIKAAKNYYTFTPESLMIEHLLMDSLSNHFTAIRQQKRISGSIRNESGIGIASVIVQLDGDKTSTDTTDTNGFFDFNPLPAGGSYSVTPSKPFYTFDPISTPVPELKNDTSLQFTGHINQFQISGTIRTGSGVPIPSVPVILSGDSNQSDTTDPSGSYRFTGLSAGSRLIVKPVKAFHTFVPDSQLIQSLQSDTIRNFTGTAQLFTLSGQTLDQNFQPLASVQIQLTGGSTSLIFSGPTGLFSFPNLTGGLSYCLKAQKPFYRFTPDSTLITRLGSDTGLILQAALQHYTLSGQVRLIGGQPLPGTPIYLRGDSISQTLSDQNGNFSFFNLKAGRSYRLVPAKELYRFSPDSSVIVSLEKDSLVLFVATQQNYSISGLIQNEVGQAVSQALISLSGGDYRTTLSDPQGAFAFPDLISGTAYSVAAAKNFYSFVPPQYQIANLKSDTFLIYTATRQTHTLSGRLTTPSGIPLPSASVSLNNQQAGSATTDQNGDYRFEGLAAGLSYTIKPSMPFYGFLPESLTIQELIHDTIGNFTGIQKNYSISGTVYRHADPVPGVMIHLMGNNRDSVLTDSLGYYIFYVNAGYSYSVYPIRESYAFEPAQRNYPLLIQNEVQNFFITPDFKVTGIQFEVQPYPVVKPNCVWLKWNTNQPARGVLRYGQNPQTLTELLSIDETASEHTSTLYSLLADRTYYYSVTAITGQDSLTSTVDSFQIYSEIVDTIAPYCLTQTITAYRQQAFLNLELNEPCLVSLMYGTGSAMLDQTYSSGRFGRKFMIRLTGLSPGTTYYYRLVLIDLSGHTYIQNPELQKSGSQSVMSNSFITPTQSDQQVPDPGEIEVLYYYNSETAIRWHSSEPAQYRIEIELDGDSVGTIATTPDYYLDHHTVLGELPALGHYNLRLTLIDPENNTAVFSIPLPEIQQAPEPPVISQFKYSDDRTFFWMSDSYASGRILWTLGENQRHFWMIDNELTKIHRFKAETHRLEASLGYYAVSCYPGIGICSSPLEGYIFIDPVLENDPLDGSGVVSRHSSYPNPFNSQTVIRFSTTRSERLNLTIYNHLGERVQTLIDRFMPAGDHQQI
ncbi:MAG: carboxypeptidase regulatory-like domain-containing protein, partial [Candidatus Delongbacteria bacterium]|nr:carboxypeptidase regulatory-like domain-containing protein [Candidatus Delongbacteria bacterium]